MHRWTLPAIAAVIGCTTLTNGARADEKTPATKLAVTPVAATLMNAEAYRTASPYNITTVGRTIPNPLNNRQNMTLPCENPNQNFASFVPAQPDCIKNIFGRSNDDCSSCGRGGKFGKHGKGECSQGNCATCSNTYNFVWSGSRSFFGESSREFFERPPSVDAARHNWNPIPVLYRTAK